MTQKFKMQNSKCKILVLGIILLILLPQLAAAQTSNPTGFEKICSREVGSLAVCVQQIYLFSLGFGALLALLMLILAGYKYMTAQGNATQVEGAKESFANAFIGLVIIFVAFILLNLINPDLVRFRDPSKTLTLPAIPAGPGQPGTPGPLPDEVQKLAQEMLSNPNIKYDDVNITFRPHGPRETMTLMSQGQYPFVCDGARTAADCKQGTVFVNADLLRGLLLVVRLNYSFTITSFTTGTHTPGSDHYRGYGVDIVPNGSRSVWQNFRTELNKLRAGAKCEDKTNPNLDVADCNANQVSHIHWSVQ